MKTKLFGNLHALFYTLGELEYTTSEIGFEMPRRIFGGKGSLYIDAVMILISAQKAVQCRKKHEDATILIARKKAEMGKEAGANVSSLLEKKAACQQLPLCCGVVWPRI